PARRRPVFPFRISSEHRQNTRLQQRILQVSVGWTSNHGETDMRFHYVSLAALAGLLACERSDSAKAAAAAAPAVSAQDTVQVAAATYSDALFDTVNVADNAASL